MPWVLAVLEILGGGNRKKKSIVFTIEDVQLFDVVIR